MKLIIIITCMLNIHSYEGSRITLCITVIMIDTMSTLPDKARGMVATSCSRKGSSCPVW